MAQARPGEPIEVGGAKIPPGEQRTINLPVARLYTHTEMNMPVHVMHGRRSGPCLFVCAALHGDEILGVEIIRRLLRRNDVRRLKGTLLAVPVVNVFGFVSHSRYLPDRRDLNRFFPGRAKGSLASRLAEIFMEEIVQPATHGIDLHTGANHRTNLPQIRASLEDEATAELARAFGTPVIIDARMRDGSLRQAVMEQNKPMLVFEAGEVLRFDELSIRYGLNGILAVMRHLDMLPKRRRPERASSPLVARSTRWVRAPHSGILESLVGLGDMVIEGQLMGRITDPLGEAEVTVPAPVNGLVIGRLCLPLVHRGDALFNVACPGDEPIPEDTTDLLEEVADFHRSALALPAEPPFSPG